MKRSKNKIPFDVAVCLELNLNHAVDAGRKSEQLCSCSEQNLIFYSCKLISAPNLLMLGFPYVVAVLDFYQVPKKLERITSTKKQKKNQKNTKNKQ